MNVQAQAREPYRMISRRDEVQCLLETIIEMVGHDLSFAVYLKIQADKYEAMLDDAQWERNCAEAE